MRTPAFKKWFGDWENDPENASKVVDENGEPLVVYHGTPKGGFKAFKGANYFTPLKEYAELYHDKSASAISVKRYEDSEVSPETYAVFLNIREPFDTRDESSEARKIFDNEYFGNYGDGTPLSDKGLPDWTEGIDLEEFLKEETDHDNFDGLMLDEGGYPDGKGGVTSRGISYVNFDPTQIKSATDNRGTFDGSNPDITFSVRNLASMHTLHPDNLKKAAKLGGIPLPSVAVSRLDQPYAWGGESGITLIAGSELADPALGNDVYSADAYTGTFPSLQSKKSKDAPKVLKEINRLASIAAERYQMEGYFKLVDSIEDNLERFPNKEETRAYLGNHYFATQLLFAASQDYKFRTPMKDTKFFMWEDAQLRKDIEDFASSYNTEASEEERQTVQDQMSTALMAAAERADAEGQRPLYSKALRNEAERIKDNFRMGELTSVSKGSHKDTTLKSLLDFPAMYEAYPHLADMRVRVYRPTRSYTSCERVGRDYFTLSRLRRKNSACCARGGGSRVSGHGMMLVLLRGLDDFFI